MKRILCVVLVGMFCAFCAGCSIVYSSVSYESGEVVSEIGLFGVPAGMGGASYGVFPIWRHSEPQD